AAKILANATSSREIPAKQNREFIADNRESSGRNRERAAKSSDDHGASFIARAGGREPFGNQFKIRSSAPTLDCEQEVLARLPKPVVIALAVLAGLVALPIVWVALVRFLLGDGLGLGVLFRLGLLVVVIVGSRRLARHLKESPTSRESLRTAGVAVLESLRTAGVAVAKALPPLARAIAGGTSQLFHALNSAVIYLHGCRWPVALIWFLVTCGVMIVLSIPLVGMF